MPFEVVFGTVLLIRFFLPLHHPAVAAARRRWPA